MSADLRRATRLARRASQLHKAGDPGEAVRLYAQSFEVASQCRAGLPTAEELFALHNAAQAAKQLSQFARNRGLASEFDRARRLMFIAFDRAREVAIHIAQSKPAEWEAFEGDVGQFRRLYASVIHNWGCFQREAGVIVGADGAGLLFDQAVKFDPELCEAWINLGHCYAEQGNRMRAEAAWLRAIECPTPSAEAVFNLSFIKLLYGDYVDGWRDYEKRWATAEFWASYGRPYLKAPLWDGSSFDGTLLLHGEQGAGDILMMARYIPVITTGVGRLVVEVHENLVRLFAVTFPGIEVVKISTSPPAHDAHLPMMSLPAIMGTLVETVPPPIRFASNPVEKGDQSIESPRIGLCWKGSAGHVNDRNRSMPSAAVEQLFRIPGLAWQSLQWNEATEPPLDPLGNGDFLETANTIARCALVITVDTSVAHLAASMGVETWILLPHHGEYRWLKHRTDSPWYPSATLYRQERPGDWSGIVGRVHSELYRRFVRDEVAA
jgi:hypothetical protein